MKLKSFAFIIINTFIYFNTFYYYLFYYKNALQTPTLNAGFTRRFYSVHVARPQRAHGALEYPQRCHSVAIACSQTRQAAAFVLSMLKINAASWRSRRLHSVSTGLLTFAQRAPRSLQFF